MARKTKQTENVDNPGVKYHFLDIFTLTLIVAVILYKIYVSWLSLQPTDSTVAEKLITIFKPIDKLINFAVVFSWQCNLTILRSTQQS